MSSYEKKPDSLEESTMISTQSSCVHSSLRRTAAEDEYSNSIVSEAKTDYFIL